MHETKLYSITENGVEVFKGSAAEVCEHFDLPNKDMIYYYHRTGYLLLRKYTIEYAGVRITKSPKEEKQEEKKREPTKHEQKLNYLAWHLQHYGNTTLKGHPSKYKEELKQMGIEFTYRKYDKKDYILECY